MSTDDGATRDDMVLVTGAAGVVGGFIRPALERSGRRLRHFDIVPTPSESGRSETVIGNVEDFDAVRAAMKGVDAVVHLGGIPKEAPFEALLATNVVGTWNVLEAARIEGVSRVVLASSNHAAGFYPRPTRDEPRVPATVVARPDTFYGWSKAAIEALGSLYHDRFGIDVVVLRIAQSAPAPSPNPRGQALWMSPDDTARLVEAALSGPGGFHVVWGVSANSAGELSPDEGQAIGFDPRDDAATVGVVEQPDVNDRIGGQFCDVPLGEWHR